MGYTYSLISDTFEPEDLVGTRAMNLHLMVHLNVNIPGGFVISGGAFDDFLVKNNLVENLITELNRLGDAGDTQIRDVSKNIRRNIINTPMPAEIQEEILLAYGRLSSVGDSYVVVRQSPLNDNLNESHFNKGSIGYLGIQGDQALIESVKTVWADLFSASALSYRLNKGYEGNLTQPVVVQRMVNADVSGTIYNFNPEDKDHDYLYMTAKFGFYSQSDVEKEGVDVWVFDKHTNQLKKSDHNTQTKMYVKSDKNNTLKEIPVSESWQNKEKLEQYQVQKLMSAVKNIETEWSGFVEISWMIESGILYISELNELTSDEIVELEMSHAINSIEKKVEAPKVLKPSAPLTESRPQTATQSIVPSNAPNVSQNTPKDPESGLGPSLISLTGTPSKDQDQPSPMSKVHAKTSQEIQRVEEIKTVTEVWWSHLGTGDEIDEFSNNYDGLGPLEMSNLYAQTGSTPEAGQRIIDYIVGIMEVMDDNPLIVDLDRNTSVQVQVDLLSKVRNKHEQRNFWVILPEARSADEISNNKKEFTSNGFRRTTKFKILQKISQPFFLGNLNVVSDQAIDGVVVDIQDLYRASLSSLDNIPELNSGNLPAMLEYLHHNLSDNNDTNLDIYLNLPLKGWDDKFVSLAVDIAAAGVIYPKSDLIEFKKLLTKIESQNLTQSLKKIKKSLNRL